MFAHFILQLIKNIDLIDTIMTLHNFSALTLLGAVDLRFGSFGGGFLDFANDFLLSSWLDNLAFIIKL